MQKTTTYLKATLLAITLVLGSAYVSAWTAPVSDPPGGSVSLPVNTGNTDQNKTGGLGVGNLNSVGDVLVANGVIKPGSFDGTITTCGASGQPQAGSMRYNSTSKTLEYCDGIAWKAVGSGGSSGSTLGGITKKELIAKRATQGAITCSGNNGRSGADRIEIDIMGKYELRPSPYNTIQPKIKARYVFGPGDPSHYYTFLKNGYPGDVYYYTGRNRFNETDNLFPWVWSETSSGIKNFAENGASVSLDPFVGVTIAYDSEYVHVTCTGRWPDPKYSPLYGPEP